MAAAVELIEYAAAGAFMAATITMSAVIEARKAKQAANDLEEEKREAERRLEASEQAAEARVAEEKREAERRLEASKQAAEARVAEEKEAKLRVEREAERRLEEERQAAEARVAEEIRKERKRVLDEKRQKWMELNRDYPIPEFLQPFVTGVAETIEDDNVKDRFVNVGVLGNAGTGKSSLINAILKHLNKSNTSDQPQPQACFEGDGTRAPTPYLLTNYGERVRIWDLPGQGTPSFPAETYLKNMGLKYFDTVLVVTCGRLLENDSRLLQAIRFAQIGVKVVRTKVDQAVEDGKVDEGLSAEDVLQKIRDNLSEQLGESDASTDKIHLVTVRTNHWTKFGNIDDLCQQICAGVDCGDRWLVVGDEKQPKKQEVEA